MSERRFFSLKELPVLLLILLTAVVLFAAGRGLFDTRSTSSEQKVSLRARLYRDRTPVLELDLIPNQEKTIRVPGIETVQITRFANGSVAFTHSDCPDKRCIRSGKLSRAGAFAACLPHNVLLRIDKVDTQRSEGADLDLILGASQETKP